MSNSDYSKRIQWACRRGMLELDLILIPFFNANYHLLTEVQQQQFAKLLTLHDPDLHRALTGNYSLGDEALDALVLLIRARHGKT